MSNQEDLLRKVSQLAKASESWSPDPDGVDDDQGLDDYLGQLTEPDPPDPDAGSVHALRDSAMIGMHLARAKIGSLQGNDEAVHKHLNKAIAYHSRLHGQIHAAAAQASEIDPMRIREQDY
jgi:hypothetical protein